MVREVYLCQFPTDLFPETTQIWGKEFPDGMLSMLPGNSSFFLSYARGGADTPAVPIGLPQRPSSNQLQPMTSKLGWVMVPAPSECPAFPLGCCTLFLGDARHRDVPHHL